VGEARWAALGAPLGLLLVVGLLASPGSLGSLSGPPRAPSPVPPILSHTPFIRHVVIIVLENQGITSVWGHAPYERYLAGTYGNATNFYAACHPSAPNYLAMIAAVTNQCGTDAWKNTTNTTVGDLLDAAGGSYAQYAENLPSAACPHPASVTSLIFATRHTPFLYFRDVLKNQTFCRQHVMSSANFNASVVNGTLPNLSFYTPNLCDDGHTGCGKNTTGAQLTAQADAWLHDFLAPMLNHTGRDNTPAERLLMKHTLFIITWDEGTNNSGYSIPLDTSFNTYTWCQANGGTGLAVCGGHVYLVFVSPYSMHTTFTADVSDYSIARTIEWLFHLPHLKNVGAFDARNAFPAMTTLFTFPSNGI
jgi:hypothetical protein